MSDVAQQVWNYDQAVERVKAKVYKWKKMTADLLQELHTARQQLSKTGVYYREGGTDGSPKTWAGFCADIGLSKRTVNRWLAKFDPDTKQIKRETKPKQLGASPPSPVDAKPKEYDIQAPQQIGETLRRKATFRLLVMRLLLHALAFVWRSMPRESAVMLKLPAPKASA